MKSNEGESLTNLSESMVLGTAQLGMNYGIANTTGQPDLAMAETIVKTAWGSGIREFDTAQAYGESENVLGTVLKRLAVSDRARIVTKPDPSIDYNDAKAIEKSIEASLSRLGCSSLYCYMLHREELLEFWNRDLREVLHSMVKNNSIQNVGVSVYSPQKALEALKTDGINFVQIPSNILDRRFEDCGAFELAVEHGKTIYIRSVFLQGLAVMDLNKVPSHMAFARPVLEKIGQLSSDLNLTKQELAIGYIKNAYPGAKILLGIENAEQMLMNIEIFQKEYPVEIVASVKGYLNDSDERILNPSLW